MKRTTFTPAVGTVYANRGGGKFECINVHKEDCIINGSWHNIFRIERVTMQNIASGWTFTAHGCGIYEDGSIDWDYSTDGHFERIER